MADCICDKSIGGCGRIMDCGSQRLCDVCEADKSGKARLSSVQQVPTMISMIEKAREETEYEGLVDSHFIAITRDGKVRSEVTTRGGWKRAVELLSPGEFERLAIVVDIPR